MDFIAGLFALPPPPVVSPKTLPPPVVFPPPPQQQQQQQQGVWGPPGPQWAGPRRVAVDLFGGDAVAERIVDGALLVVLVVCAAKAGARLLAAVSAVTDHLLRVLVAGLAFTLFVRMAASTYTSFCAPQHGSCDVSAVLWMAVNWASAAIDSTTSVFATAATTSGNASL